MPLRVCNLQLLSFNTHLISSCVQLLNCLNSNSGSDYFLPENGSVNTVWAPDLECSEHFLPSAAVFWRLPTETLRVRFLVLTSVIWWNSVLWDITTCSLVDVCRDLGRFCCFQLRLKVDAPASCGMFVYVSSRINGDTYKKTIAYSFKIVCISNIVCCLVHSSHPFWFRPNHSEKISRRWCFYWSISSSSVFLHSAFPSTVFWKPLQEASLILQGTQRYCWQTAYVSTRWSLVVSWLKTGWQNTCKCPKFSSVRQCVMCEFDRMRSSLLSVNFLTI